MSERYPLREEIGTLRPFCGFLEAFLAPNAAAEASDRLTQINPQASANMATPRAEEATGAKEVTGEGQSNAVDGLLPRLGTSILAARTPELEVHLPPPQWKFEVSGHSIEKGKVLYHVHKTDCRTGIREPPILKRYTDFYNLEMNLLDTCLRVAADIPRVPRPHFRTLLRGHASEKTIEIRKQAFRAQLEYIAQYSALHTNAAFERFLTTSRASSEAVSATVTETS